ncbi:MAG: hypothetical protein AAF430_24710 [Myxococcota bacterium]
MINPPNLTKSNYLRLPARSGQADALADFITPREGTTSKSVSAATYWYALREEKHPDRFAVFDLFADETAREGYVAAGGPGAVRKNASNLLEEGWRMRDHASLFSVLGSVVADDPVDIRLITYIPIQVADGQSEAFEELLAIGPSEVANSEPETFYWYALRDENRPGHYAIVDLYADAHGRAKHRAGDVAATLKRNAPALVRGGWEQGVLANVIEYEVIASK